MLSTLLCIFDSVPFNRRAQSGLAATFKLSFSSGVTACSGGFLGLKAGISAIRTDSLTLIPLMSCTSVFLNGGISGIDNGDPASDHLSL